MKNLRKINVILAILLCVAVSAAAIVISSVKNIKKSDKTDEGIVLSASSTVPVDLFNSDGTYRVNYADIIKGYKFNVFGQVWTVVAKNDTTKEATFWMDSTIGSVRFTNYYNNTDAAGSYGASQTAANTLGNGYYSTTWNGTYVGAPGMNGTSGLRHYLLNSVQPSLPGFQNNGNVLSGPRTGLNDNSGTASYTDNYGTTRVYYRDANKQAESRQNYGAGGSIALNWNIGSTDRLFIPSYKEVVTNWALTASQRSFSGAYSMAFLREPNFRPNNTNETNNMYVYTVGQSGTMTDSSGNPLMTHVFESNIGIRPAMNLNIAPAQKYTVTWRNFDGSVYTTLKTDTNVSYGSIPSYNGPTPTRSAPAGQMYTFTGWTVDGSTLVNLSTYSITGDTTFTAKYSGPVPVTGTVIWKNYDGTTLETDTGVAYGTTPTYDGNPPTRPATAQYTYTFNGNWSPAVTPFTGTVEYTAQYNETIRSYTITWLMDDDSVLGTETLQYGATPSRAAPTKASTPQYTYTFAWWTPSIVTVTGDATYKAVFTQTVNTYTIIWKNGTATLKTEAVDYGATPYYSGTPAQTAAGKVLTFIGWRIAGDGTNTVYNVSADSFAATNVTTGLADFTISNIYAFLTVTESVTFEAVYTAENVYVVSWKYDAKLVGQNLVFPDRPTYATNKKVNFTGVLPMKQWYNFIGWSITVNNINPEITAAPYTTPDIGNDITFYACFTATVPSVDIAPIAIGTLRYNGANQILTTMGQGRNGIIEYAFGTETLAGTGWQTERLLGKNVGDYYVWYRVVGASATVPVRITAQISPKVINAGDVTVSLIPDQPYDKKGVNPQPIVTDADGVIVTGDWVWSNNKAVGHATGVFHANGNFTVIGAADEIKAEFLIVDKESPSMNTQLLKIAFVVLCIVGILSIICVAIVCTKHRIKKSADSDINS
jgi:hypothetical protein